MRDIFDILTGAGCPCVTGDTGAAQTGVARDPDELFAVGGSTRLTHLLDENSFMMSDLHVVHLPVAPDNPYQQLLFDHLRSHGVHVEALPGEATFFRRLKLSRLPDVIHLHWLAPFFLSTRSPASRIKAITRAACFLANLDAVRGLGVRLVWTIHNFENQERRFLGIDHWLHRKVAKRADAIIVHSPSARDSVIDSVPVPAERVHIIAHGHYADWYPDNLNRQQARETIGLGEDEFVVLFFGAIREYKQVPRLISSFRAASLPKNARLLIAGKPSTRALSQRIGDQAGEDRRIIFSRGYVPDALAQVYFRAADIVALPYRQALTSGAAVLAMSFGKPLLVPDFPVFKELLADSGAVYFGSDDSSALETGLCDAFSMREQLDTRGAANRDRVTRWDWSRIGRSTSHIYRSIVSQRGGRVQSTWTGFESSDRS